MSGQQGRRIGRLGFVMDKRLSRERRANLTRTINRLRQLGFVDVWDTDDENTVLGHLAAEQYQVVFAPWHLYRKWSKLEGALGLSRVSGPTFAAYIGEPTPASALEDLPLYQRLMIFDFVVLSANELASLIGALARDSHRNGIRALIGPQAPIYCENWMAQQGAGARLDTVFTLPEMKDLPWHARANAIRVTLLALWSLIYEEGPGKADLSVAAPTAAPKAYFQVGFDSSCFVMRLFYAHKTPQIKKLLEAFWPNADPVAQPQHSPSQMLVRHADFLRVQSIQDTGDVEIIAGFLPSAPADLSPGTVRSLWIEPIAPALVTEVPFAEPGKDWPQLKALPSAPVVTAPRTGASDERKDRLLREAADKILSLKKALNEKDELIRELRSGGIGTAAPMPPPDAESLLEAFQHRYLGAKEELAALDAQLKDLEARRGQSDNFAAEAALLRGRMTALAKQEVEWMRQLLKIVTDYKETKRARTAG